MLINALKDLEIVMENNVVRPLKEQKQRIMDLLKNDEESLDILRGISDENGEKSAE